MDGFDLRAPLTKGVTVLEASAGTGKTYTIAGLATRHVAEGLELDQLLVVTFTRLATGELRERVRERLVSAERALRTGVIEDGDDLAAFLAAEDREVRRARLARAIATFDSATIATTHQFCLEALGSLGFTGNVERDCAFVEDVSDLMDDVVNDLFVRRFVGERPRFARSEAMAVARAAIEHPSTRLVPEAAAPQSDAAMRVRLAHAARGELERRKRLGSLMTFDDVLTRLADALTGDGGEQVAARLRARYRVVLVDEFQDTDPVQWQIMQRAFDHPDGTLILIGDPKQAIYAFRGADVYAYLDAARSASALGTLDMNWRSDQRLLDAYDLLFGNAKLGHPDIDYRSTRATPTHEATRLHGAPVDAALRIRVLDRTAARTTRGGFASAQPARERIAADCARDIAALLNAEPEITRGTAGAEPRKVKPGDIAVLVRRNQDAALVQEELGRVGVPAVIAGAGSVFGTDAARDWLALLEALERPSSVGRVHAAALTPFIGWSAGQVAGADDPAWETVHDQLHAWAQVLRDDGVAALLQAVTVESSLPARVLGFDGGERVLTDLRHIGQLLHASSMEEGLGAAALTQWLRRRILEAKTEGDEERARRLESDAEAVQVLTIHRSKGLEYPIVYCPFLWDPSWIPDDALPVFFHDEDGARTLDVGLSDAAYRAHQEAERAEERGEDLRLAYVALTRARHQAVIWWAGSWDSRNSPLSRLVFSRAEDGSVPADGPKEVPSDDEAMARFAALGGDGCISVERAPGAGLLAEWSAPSGGRGSWRRRRSAGESTGRGGGRRTATSPRPRTSRSARSRRVTRSRTSGRWRWWWRSRIPLRRCGGCRLRWPIFRAACGSARSCTTCSRRWTSPRRICSGRWAWRCARRWRTGGWRSGTRTCWLPRWPESWGPRSSTGSRCAPSARATGWTSWGSSCRWRVRRRRGRSGRCCVRPCRPRIRCSPTRIGSRIRCCARCSAAF
ncbi:UvrD-helicase domain-containing protein [Svornostia abyssi]|uniref:DNA 3'-5' helicase n=1 Tax=Svornostia abyssi TaxID=2898438 RepID=A0ABY5PGP4_9ACTN|nr:UvrD-helicase domain-containing protein [Parviterribacteraceae bacterium J379]